MSQITFEGLKKTFIGVLWTAPLRYRHHQHTHPTPSQLSVFPKTFLSSWKDRLISVPILDSSSLALASSNCHVIYMLDASNLLSELSPRKTSSTSRRLALYDLIGSREAVKPSRMSMGTDKHPSEVRQEDTSALQVSQTVTEGGGQCKEDQLSAYNLRSVLRSVRNDTAV